MAETLDLEFVQGDTYRRQFTFDGIDITGWTFLSQIRSGTADDTAVEATLTCTIIDGPNGVMEIVLAPADSETLDPSFIHWWDLQATTDDADVYTIVRGEVTVIAEVSRVEP